MLHKSSIASLLVISLPNKTVNLIAKHCIFADGFMRFDRMKPQWQAQQRSSQLAACAAALARGRPDDRELGKRSAGTVRVSNYRIFPRLLEWNAPLFGNNICCISGDK